jgi:hypothetical protein
VLAKNRKYRDAALNYAWHRAFLDDKYEEAERMLLEGLEQCDQFPDCTIPRIQMMYNLIALEIKWGRFIEAQCYLNEVEQEWLEHPHGILLYWDIIEMLSNAVSEAQEKTKTNTKSMHKEYSNATP